MEKRIFVLGSKDTVVGFRLVGVEGFVVRNEKEAEDALRSLVEKESTGLLIIDKSAANMVRELVNNIKIASKLPIIVEVADPKEGSKIEKDAITKFIKEAIGISV